MRFYDLFCGIGGFRLGLEQENFDCVGSCEIDKYARDIYRKNFGEFPTEEDVRLLNPSELPDFDLLTAGFPCQAFSLAGKRLGFNDERGNLFFEIIRIVKEKRPKTLFLENVRGLLFHDNGRTFGRILYELDAVGYDVEWQVVNGKYFLPQNRERVYIIGHPRETSFRKIFPLGESDQITIGTLGEAQKEGKWISNTYSRTIDANYWKGGGGNRTMIRSVDGNKLRMLTPLECERLMGFPDKWTEGVSDKQRYRCLGNSVIVPVVKEIGKYL